MHTKELINADYDNYYDRDETSLKAIRLITRGNMEEALRFAESDEYKRMLLRLTENSEDYEISYLMSCAVHYAAALQAGISNYTCLSMLKSFMQKRSSLSRASDYRNALKQEFLAFTDLVSRSKRKTYSKTVSSALRFIDDRLLSEIKMSELAQYCGCSPTTITHAFHKETGMSLTQYIKTEKIDKACQLLKETNMKSSEIAVHLGYASHSYFCRQFRQVKGMTPHQYKEHFV